MSPGQVPTTTWWPGSVHRFAVTSGLAFTTNFGTTLFLHELFGIAANVAYAIALAIVFLQSFVLLRRYVYGKQTESGTVQFLKYAPSAVAFRVLEYAAFLLLHSSAGIDYRIVICLIAAGSFVTKYLFYRWAVFRG